MSFHEEATSYLAHGVLRRWRQSEKLAISQHVSPPPHLASPLDCQFLKIGGENTWPINLDEMDTQTMVKRLSIFFI